MWNNQYDPPPSLFDKIEPVAYTVLVIAFLIIIPFTPLSPFSGRDRSALDQLVGVNALPDNVTSAHLRPGAEPVIRQVEAPATGPIAR